ncbi:MAG: hypothetical protein IPK26_11725 [Planctomycetes bacterium]|nr:hypothetical protein [Planctomycetota bacterium]
MVPCLCALSLPGQQATWRLPPHGLAQYSATDTIVGEVGGKPMSMLESVSTRCHPLLFADELVDGGRRWREAPWSLDSIPMWLAWDLTTWDKPGAIDVRWPRIADYGEVRFLGKVAVVDGYGWQQIKGRLTRADPKSPGGSFDPELLRFERHYGSEALAGELVVRRRYDPQKGVVAEFVWSIDATLTVAPRHTAATLRGTETWRLVDVQGNRDPATGDRPGFSARIDAAIDRAAARQLRWLLRPDGTLAAGENRGAVHGPSLHALMLHGLARAGRRAGDPGIDGALAALLQRPMTEPHGHALTILAIVGLHAPAADRGRRAAGAAPAVELPAAMRAAVAARVTALRGLARRGDRDGKNGIWWAFARDSSNWDSWQTWISVQALDAAARAGVPVADAVFEDCLRHLLHAAVAAGSGPEPERQPESTAKPPSGTRVNGGVPMSCWMDGQWRAPWMGRGDATAGAMAAILCCRRRVQDGALLQQADDAVRGGFAWLSQHWTGRHNPAVLGVETQHRGWMAMALAWLADESGVRWLDGRDLYFEMAATLLEEEGPTKGAVLGSVIETPAALVLWRPGAVDVTPPLTPARK